MKKPSSILLDTKKIQEILPHRFPFLLVDKVLELDLDEGTIIAQKNVTVNEQFFMGHFPKVPLMPGVLVLEALAQTGGIFVYQKGYQKKIAVLLNIAHAKFRLPIVPGDIIYLHAKAIHLSNNGGKMLSKAVVNDKIAVEAEISFALVDIEKI